MTANRLQLYLHTIRHIKLRQLAHLAGHRIFPAVKVVPFDGAVLRRPDVDLIPGAACSGSGGGPSEFRFLNIAKQFEPDRMNWCFPDMSKLWRYNVHYFDYLHSGNFSASTIATLITSWITHHPAGAEDAWEPFPSSLRTVNWIKLFVQPGYRDNLDDRWLRSLYHQVLWLERNLERHLLANHYFKNAKALVFAGVFFAGADADRWLKDGLNVLDAELDEQVLPDGGHFERTPMYHAMILADCLDLLNLVRGAPEPVQRAWNPGLVEKLEQACRSMLRFLSGVSHPDGQISLFNDAAIGIELTYAELSEYFERLTKERVETPDGPCWSFPESGYFIMAPRPGDWLIVDCGDLGPSYQQGHAHCDTLSFELSLNGRRVVVDSGCCQYLDGAIRRYNRGSTGHNSVTIDGEDQSEVWGAHRCARRASPLYGRLERRGDGTLLFAGGHDGYRRLTGKPTHYRTITWCGDQWLIEDRVEGDGVHDLESRLHLHPSLSIRVDDGSAVIGTDAGPLATISALGGAPVRVQDGWYCPEFGIRQRCAVITTNFSRTRLPVTTGWAITVN